MPVCEDGHGHAPKEGRGVARPWVSRPQLSHAGQGVTKRQLPLLRGSDGTGVGYGVGINASQNRERLLEYFAAQQQALPRGLADPER